MSHDEFSLIRQFFADKAGSLPGPDIILGIGDDAAVIDVPHDLQLVSTIDTLVADRHFPAQTSAQDIAYKSLAVNVSDLAAMAAEPAFFLLSLTLPEADEDFLAGFSAGLFAAAAEFGIQLAGGDTCKGPLSITIQANGYVPKEAYLTRSGARAGDKILVSGELGYAAMGLAELQGRLELPRSLAPACISKLNRPIPRLDLVPLLRDYATSGIDISDGLVADLGHILQLSRVGARIDRQQLPVCEWIRQQNRYDYALAGGDDYQILFTVAPENIDRLIRQARQSAMELTVIGEITDSSFVMIEQQQQRDLSNYKGFDHFAS